MRLASRPERKAVPLELSGMERLEMGEKKLSHSGGRYSLQVEIRLHADTHTRFESD